jgi:hypothetical protein
MFDAFGVALARGRTFRASDGSGAPPVIVLSRIAAQALFGDTDPIGRPVVFERRRASGEVARPPRTVTVVGVVGDTDSGSVGRRSQGVAYLALEQHYEDQLMLVARAREQPEALVPHLRTALLSLDPALVVHQAGTGLAIGGPDSTFPRIMAGMAASLGSLALFVALGGLYGVLSSVVTGRTREIGIRIALGAGARRIRRMVVVEGLSPVFLGLVGGLGLGLIARVGMPPALGRFAPDVDFTLAFLIPVVFTAAGLAACYLPARRASSVDPNAVLKDQ